MRTYGELVAENEKLLKDYYAVSQTCVEQKAEIERLTEELAEEKKQYFDMQTVAANRYMENCTLIKQRNELQKQVDELKENNQILVSKIIEECNGCLIARKIEKDTAKEILENLYYAIDGGSFWLEETGRKTDLVKAEDMLAYMRKKAEEYGVEVDE